MSRTVLNALCLSIVAGLFVTAPAAVASQEESNRAREAAAIVDTVATRIINVMQDEALDATERRGRLENLMENNLDLPAITNFALGRHRDKLETAQRLQFEEVFGDYVIATYARHVSQHPIEAIEIERTRQINESTAAVSTRVSREGGEMLLWTWRLYAGNNGYRVVDLQTPEISLAVTYRRHIGAAFENTDLDSVLAMLEEHVSSDTVIPADRAAQDRLFGKQPDLALAEQE